MAAMNRWPNLDKLYDFMRDLSAPIAGLPLMLFAPQHKYKSYFGLKINI